MLKIMAVVIVHGGAYTIPDAAVGRKLEGCRRAAQSAYKALTEGKSATDAGRLIKQTVNNQQISYFLV